MRRLIPLTIAAALLMPPALASISPGTYPADEQRAAEIALMAQLITTYPEAARAVLDGMPEPKSQRVIPRPSPANPPPSPAPKPAPERLEPEPRPIVAGVEQWRELVDVHWLDEDVDLALAIMRCESAGRPDAINWANRDGSHDSGLFQHNSRYWVKRSAAAGLPGADVLDPEANIQVAAWLYYWGGGIGHWRASRHCWG